MTYLHYDKLNYAKSDKDKGFINTYFIYAISCIFE